MKKDNELFAIEDSYCPICGKFIKANSPLHHCLKKDLKKIDKEEDIDSIEEDRTYDDKLNEFDEYYDSDKYYERDDREE